MVNDKSRSAVEGAISRRLGNYSEPVNGVKKASVTAKAENGGFTPLPVKNAGMQGSTPTMQNKMTNLIELPRIQTQAPSIKTPALKAPEPMVDPQKMSEMIDIDRKKQESAAKVGSIPGVSNVSYKRDENLDKAVSDELNNLYQNGAIDENKAAEMEMKAGDGDYDGFATDAYKAYDDAKAAEVASAPVTLGKVKEPADSRAKMYESLGVKQVADEDLNAAHERMNAAEAAMTFGESDVDITEIRPSGVIKMVESGEIPLSAEARAQFDEKLEQWKNGQASQDDVKQVVLDYYANASKEMQESEQAVQELEGQKKAYDYYQPGVDAIEEAKSVPQNTAVNEDEQDGIYTSVNGLAGGNNDFTHMPEELKVLYNSIYNAQGIEAANAFAEKTRWACMAARAQSDREYWQQMIDEGGVAANIAQNIGSVLAFVGEIPAAANTIAKTFTGKYVDKNSSVYSSNQFRETTRSATYQKILGDGTSGWSKAFATVYNLVSSTADSACMMALQMVGVPTWATASTYFAASFNDGFDSARERGADDGLAALYGIGKGLIGAATEEYSLEKIISLPALGKEKGFKEFKRLMLSIGVGGLVEGSEEGAEDLLGWMWDGLVMGENSETQNRIKEYEASGMQHSDAVLKAWEDNLLELGMDIGGGIFSGVLLGTFSNVGYEIGAKRARNQEAAQAAIYKMMGIDPKSETAAMDAMGKVGAAVASGNPDAQAAAVVLMSGTNITTEQAGAILESAPEVAESFGYDAKTAADLKAQVDERVKSVTTEGMPSVEDGKVLTGEKTNPATEEMTAAAEEVNKVMDLKVEENTNPNGNTVKTTLFEDGDLDTEKAPQQEYKLTPEDAALRLQEYDITPEDVSAITNELVKQGMEQGKAQEKAMQETRDVKKSIRKGRDSLSSALLHPQEAASKHIPTEFVGSVATFLDFLTEYTTNPTSENGKKKVDDLRKAYKEIAAGGNSEAGTTSYSYMYDPEIDSMLEYLGEQIESGVDFRHMSLEDLHIMDTVVKSMTYCCTNANKLIASDSRYTLYEAAVKSYEELTNAPNRNNGFQRFVTNYLYKTLQPLRAIRMMTGYKGDSVFYGLFDTLNQGAIQQEQYKLDLQKNYDAWMQENSGLVNKWFGRDAEWIDTGWKDVNGKPVVLTKGMMLSLVMHSKNDQNMTHCSNGGLIVPNQDFYKKGKMSEAYTEGTTQFIFTPEMAAELEASLTPAERSFIAATQNVMLGCTDLINMTSEKTVGFKKARVENYFTIKSDSDFTAPKFESIMRDGSLEGAGYLKERQSGASNPIMLEDIYTVANRQINNTSRYAGIAPSVRDITAVFGTTFTSRGDDGNLKYEGSVQKQIGEETGKTGKNFFEQLIGDVQGNVQPKSDADKFVRGLTGNYVQATLMGNPSVMIKQAASYFSAGSELGMDNLMQGLFMKSTISDEELAQYTPLLEIRKQGMGSDEINTAMNNAKSGNKVSQALTNAPVIGKFFNGIQEIDVWTVRRLIPACQLWVEKNTGLKKGDDGYMEAVASKFNDTVQNTQPNYTVMQRPSVLRSNNEAFRALMMFKTQPLQNAGMLIDAVGERASLNGQNVTTEQKKAANSRVANATGAFITQNIAFTAMTLVANALLGNMRDWREDKGKGAVTGKSVLEGLGKKFIQGFMSSFAGGSEAYDLAALISSGGEYKRFDSSVPAIDVVNNFMGFVQAASKLVSKDGINLENVKNFYLKNDTTISQFTGIPLSNVRKLITGAFNIAQDAKDESLFRFYSTDPRFQAEKYANAYTAYKEAGGEGSKFYNTAEMILEYGNQEDKLHAIMNFGGTPEQKAILDANIVRKKGYHAEGAVVMNESGTVVADYSSGTMRELAMRKNDTINKHTPYEAVSACVEAGMCDSDGDGRKAYDLFVEKRGENKKLDSTEFLEACDIAKLTSEQRKWWADYLGVEYNEDASSDRGKKLASYGKTNSKTTFLEMSKNAGLMGISDDLYDNLAEDTHVDGKRTRNNAVAACKKHGLTKAQAEWYIKDVCGYSWDAVKKQFEDAAD